MWAMSQSCVDKVMIAQKISKNSSKVINLAHITSVSLLVMGICGKITVIKNYS
jgi:hypothetical protein